MAVSSEDDVVAALLCHTRCDNTVGHAMGQDQISLPALLVLLVSRICVSSEALVIKWRGRFTTGFFLRVTLVFYLASAGCQQSQQRQGAVTGQERASWRWSPE